MDNDQTQSSIFKEFSDFIENCFRIISREDYSVLSFDFRVY